MNKKELEFFRKIILEERQQILDMLERSKNNNEQATKNSKYTTHLADMGSDTMILEHSSYFTVRDRKYMQHIDAALLRIEKGEYGICFGCGNKIPKERLKFVPITRHCVQCKN